MVVTISESANYTWKAHPANDIIVLYVVEIYGARDQEKLRNTSDQYKYYIQLILPIIYNISRG